VNYEVVYSAALERQGLGMTLSGVVSGSSLLAFANIDTLETGDASELRRSLRNYESRLVGPQQTVAWKSL